MIPTLVLAALTSTLQAPSVTIHDDLKGAGPIVKVGDIVSVDYTGTLDNGSEFDSTRGKEPFLFMVGTGSVIKGWDLGVAGMHEGGKRELTIPAALGYGSKSVGPIPANSTLHFTISLLKVEPKVQVTVLTKGAGPLARVNDRGYFNFSGGVQGKPVLFDTADLKKPVPIIIGEATLPIGFAAALVGMQEGEKRKVVIPPEIAYGKAGVPKQDQGDVKAGSRIPPNSVMEFTFELVKLEPAQP